MVRVHSEILVLVCIFTEAMILYMVKLYVLLLKQWLIYTANEATVCETMYEVKQWHCCTPRSVAMLNQ